MADWLLSLSVRLTHRFFSPRFENNALASERLDTSGPDLPEQHARSKLWAVERAVSITLTPASRALPKRRWTIASGALSPDSAALKPSVLTSMPVLLNHGFSITYLDREHLFRLVTSHHAVGDAIYGTPLKW
jgi:hypothetical protein